MLREIESEGVYQSSQQKGTERHRLLVVVEESFEKQYKDYRERGLEYLEMGLEYLKDGVVPEEGVGVQARFE